MLDMTLKSTIQVLEQMQADGVMKTYAIGGAMAVVNYTETFTTRDVDVVVPYETFAPGVNALQPIADYLSKRGYGGFTPEGEIMINNWPVQFLPPTDPLDAEALAEAVEVTFPAEDDTIVKTRVLRAEHLVAIALKLGRPDKDPHRVDMLERFATLDMNKLDDLLNRYDLREKWENRKRHA